MVSRTSERYAKAKHKSALSLATPTTRCNLPTVRDEHVTNSAGRFQDCPFLPQPDGAMDWRSMHRHRSGSPEVLYAVSLQYGQFLWRQGLAARALLAVDRGLFCACPSDVAGPDAPPFPYRAIAWIVTHTPGNVFLGNPRVHYQHLADRVRGERQQQKRWRSWACWWLVRLARPDFPADPRHDVREPAQDAIAHQLLHLGSPVELECWRTACEDALTYARTAAERTGLV